MAAAVLPAISKTILGAAKVAASVGGAGSAVKAATIGKSLLAGAAAKGAISAGTGAAAGAAAKAMAPKLEPIPEQEKPKMLPQIDSERINDARRQEVIRSLSRRRGRESTILTNRLGG